MKQVAIYTTQYCPHCVRVKALLARKKIAFKEIDLTNDSQKREEAEKKTGWMSIPMIFIGDEFIGGADELFRLDAAGQLEMKLK